ncbi:MAG: hypothetical protein E7616_03195 [Ruminococcaceae bacterium]|nr:hypothetical protein [Oscillospiraceae bacterium]
MICERCKHKKATVRYTYTVNGSTNVYSLCEDCYLAVSGSDYFFSGWLFPGSIQLNADTNPKLKCDLCGSGFDDIAANGKVGCARCYRTFEKKLAPMIARLHGDNAFKQDNCQVESSASMRLIELQQQMDKAIEEENFELAAKLRDEIKALNQKEGE